VRIFLDELLPPFADKALKSLDLLQQQGLRLGMPHTRPITGYPFWELRVQFSGDIARIFYFAIRGRRLLLLHGFVKKDRKTPRSELAIASRRYAEFISRSSR
jgi:phage-related protein